MADLGHGVPEDDRAAVDWYRKMAKTGEPLTQYMLGRRYEIGRGVERDLVKAAGWYVVAANNGSTEAKEKVSEVTSSLTDVQNQHALDWAAHCQSLKFEGCD